MNSDLKNLISLQAIDLEIQELCHKAESFPAKSMALDDQLNSAKAAVSKSKDAIQDNQAKRKQLESEVADAESKISKYKEQLMIVKTNEEYKAMVKEIGYNQTSLASVEDEILALMVGLETLEEAVKITETRLAEDQKTVQAERSHLEELNSADTIALEAYLSERKILVREISEDVFFRYERIGKARGGIALSKASDEACNVCNVRMRPQKFQEVRKNDQIITCDSCARILYDPENLDHPFEVA